MMAAKDVSLARMSDASFVIKVSGDVAKDTRILNVWERVLYHNEQWSQIV